MGLNQCASLSIEKGRKKQNVCKNITEFVEVFLSFILWLCRMNLAMVLQWKQVTFECYESIQMLYIEKTFWCVHGKIDVCDVGAWLEKGNLGRGTLCGEGMTIEVSTGMVGRIILVGKSQREKTICWHRLERNILLDPNKFFMNNVWRSFLNNEHKSQRVGVSHKIRWYLDLHSMSWCSIMLYVVPRLARYVW